MKSNILGLMILFLLVSCHGNKGKEVDSTVFYYEADSIVIDESSRLSPDSTAVKTDSLPKKKMYFKSVDELKSYLNTSSDRVAYSKGIIPLIAEKSLEYAQKLVNNDHDGFIIVDKSRMKVILFDKFGREKLTFGMACAKKYGTKHKKADSRTPEGFFTAEGIYDSTEWLFTDDEGVTSKKKGQFGPRFIRLRCPNTYQIGIHGTCAPWSIGHRTSHGCIRVTNDNILELVKHVTPGMPIIVVPGKKDMETNMEEGFDIPWIPSSFDAKEPKTRKIEPKTDDNNEIINGDSIVGKKDKVNENTDQSVIHSPDSTENTLKELKEKNARPDTITVPAV